MFDYVGRKEDNPEKVTDKFYVVENGVATMQWPIKFNVRKPIDPSAPEGAPRDQTWDAAKHMRYAASLKLSELQIRQTPRMGRAIIVGGAPSVLNHLDEIRSLAAEPDNRIFALNWSHTWLLQHSIVPHGCVLFEIDVEPETVLKAAHPDVTYYICSHCHEKTFDELTDYKRVLWHTPPNSEVEKAANEELFKDAPQVGGGIGTFLRTVSIAMFMGYRNMELFGVDSSFPDNAKSTHVDGYETANVVETDAFYVYAKNKNTGQIKRFRTVGYLALQVEEFKEYCRVNHHHFALRVHGNGLLGYVHKEQYPMQYE